MCNKNEKGISSKSCRPCALNNLARGKRSKPVPPKIESKPEEKTKSPNIEVGDSTPDNKYYL